MNAPSFLNVILYIDPPAGASINPGDLAIAIANSWWVIIYPWIATAVLYFTTPFKSTILKFIPILSLILLAATNAFFTYKLCTTRYTGPEDYYNFTRPFVFLLWPLHLAFALHFVLFAYKTLKTKSSLKLKILNTVCFSFLIYPMTAKPLKGLWNRITFEPTVAQ